MEARYFPTGSNATPLTKLSCPVSCATISAGLQLCECAHGWMSECCLCLCARANACPRTFSLHCLLASSLCPRTRVGRCMFNHCACVSLSRCAGAGVVVSCSRARACTLSYSRLRVARVIVCVSLGHLHNAGIHQQEQHTHTHTSGAPDDDCVVKTARGEAAGVARHPRKVHNVCVWYVCACARVCVKVCKSSWPLASVFGMCVRARACV